MTSTTTLLAVLAALGWATAIVAILAALHYARAWSTLWHWAWDLRQQGFQPTPSSFAPSPDGVLARWLRRPQQEGPLRRVAEAAAPVADQPLVELTTRMMELIFQESEDWRRDELASIAREMLREGATEAEVLHVLHEAVTG